MTLEREVQRDVKRAVELRGAMWLKIHGHALQKRGWPDVRIEHRRFNGWVEFKSSTGKLSSIQRETISMIRRQGGLVAVVRPEDWEAEQRSIEETGVDRHPCEWLMAVATGQAMA